jgi:hypothetical protein
MRVHDSGGWRPSGEVNAVKTHCQFSKPLSDRDRQKLNRRQRKQYDKQVSKGIVPQSE